jgi:hypothetical protein
VAALVLCAALAAVLVSPTGVLHLGSGDRPPSAVPPSLDSAPSIAEHRGRVTTRDRPAPGRPIRAGRSAGGAGTPAGGTGAADGSVGDGVTVFDDVPAVTHLDPALLGALRAMATDAARAGVRFVLNSGWRSSAYQERLLNEAVAEYGSPEEAARWVATPSTSPHVSGDAVDLGPSASARWLAEHGARYGLCQIYRNEPWHFELRPAAAAQGCPALYDDPTDDPRMQQ